ncbi:uncharacterized protein LOC115898235 [Rhinopithecus roxellana]|uniref:uncharacterized protein LOC115898235 n=1 Tax=Rhinopithecus roxellana TaxID=61622 RepID=UPI0012377A10|nr:uncharacterized protein LOC115898235 [Rhinopithecus roxellana]
MPSLCTNSSLCPAAPENHVCSELGTACSEQTPVPRRCQLAPFLWIPAFCGKGAQGRCSERSRWHSLARGQELCRGNGAGTPGGWHGAPRLHPGVAGVSLVAELGIPGQPAAATGSAHTVTPSFVPAGAPGREEVVQEGVALAGTWTHLSSKGITNWTEKVPSCPRPTKPCLRWRAGEHVTLSHPGCCDRDQGSIWAEADHPFQSQALEPPQGHLRGLGAALMARVVGGQLGAPAL